MNRLLSACVAFLLPCAALAAPVPERFVSGWREPVDPDKDCKFQRAKGALIIEMPGTVHDYNQHRKCLNAPRLLRDIEGDFAMEVRLRIDCCPSFRSSVVDLPSFVSAGLLVIPPKKYGMAFFSSQYRVGGQGIEAEGCSALLDQAFERGGSSGIWTKQDPRWPFKAKPDYVWLRLDRQGELLGMDISPDRKHWHGIGGGQKIGLPAKLAVGLFACTTSGNPSRVVFDQLTITRGKKAVPWEFVSGWDNPIDPDQDCKIRRDKDALTMELPGSDHNYDPVRKCFNAPRVLSELEGEFDLRVRVRIDYRPSAKSTVEGQPTFVSAGFLLLHPEKDFFICSRLEYAVSQQGSRPEAYAVQPRPAWPRWEGRAPKGKEAEGYAVMKRWFGDSRRKGNPLEGDHGRPREHCNDLWERGWEKWPLPEKAEYAYLRLDHRAAGWSSFFISPDGENWTRLGYLPSVPEKGKIGLAAYSTSTEPSRVRFDQLKLARSRKKSE
jgi:hypothetical protein